MADNPTTVKLGMLPVNRGSYTTGTWPQNIVIYKDNIVQFNGSSYIYLPANFNLDNPAASATSLKPYNSVPSSLNPGWQVFADGNNQFTTSQRVTELGIDSVPTSGHTNYLVTSDGVADAVASSNAKVGYYECATGGSVADKVVSAVSAPDYVLSTGGSFKIKMSNKNTAASSVTLNINGTGAKALYYDSELVTNDNTWDAEEVVDVYYDGTSYYANNVSGGGKFLTGEKVKEVGIDSTPTAGSKNLVTSGGVKSAIDSVHEEVSETIHDVETLSDGIEQDKLNSNNYIFDNYLSIKKNKYNEYVREIEDGMTSYKAMKIAIDSAKQTGTIIAGGRCGDTLYWELLNNDTVRIYGKGRMYDYVKGTNVGNTKSVVGNIYTNPFMYYYGFHITALENAIKELEREGYALTNYKGVATTETTPVATGKAFYMVKPVSEATTLNNFLVAANTGASLTVGNYATILKRNTGETYWTKVDVDMDIDEGIVYDERTVTFIGNGVQTEFNYADKLNVCNSVTVGGTLLTSGWSYDNITGNLTFTTAPANDASIVCEFAQYVNPWYIYRIEKSYHRYVWANGDAEMYTTMRTPTTSDKAWNDKTFAGEGFSITAASSSSITVNGITYTYDEWVEGYCDRTKYLAENPNEYTYNSITIDRGITYCGDWGFYRNSASVILLPEGVTEIGIWCIRYSSYTKAVSFPATLEKINELGCSRMEVLEYVEFMGNNLTYCDEKCFHNCVALKGLILPSSVTYLGGMAGYSDHEIKILNTGNATDIGDQAFQNIPMLKVIELGNVETIGNASFQYAGIESVHLPASLLSIDSQGFGGCSSLEEVVCDSEDVVSTMASFTDSGSVFQNAKIVYLKSEIESWFIRSMFYNSGKYGSYDRLINWNNAKIINAVACGILPTTALAGKIGCHYIFYNTPVEDELKLFIGGYDGENTFNTSATADWIAPYLTKIVEVEIDDKVGYNSLSLSTATNIRKVSISSKIICNNFNIATAASPNTTLTELLIGNGVTSIGTSAFTYNTGISTINIPDTVVSIGNSAFQGITASVVIGSGVKSIGDLAFNSITNLEIPAQNSIETIGLSAFFIWHGDGMTKLYLPNITSIGNTAFAQFYGAAKGCTDIYIGDKITSIGNNVFVGLTGAARVCNIHIAASQNDVTLGTTPFGNGCTVTWNDNWMNT